MKVILHYSNNPPFIPADHATKGLGGTENFACYVAKTLFLQGHHVKFFNQYPFEQVQTVEGIPWGNIEHFDPLEPADVLISFRMREVFQLPIAARLKVLILADTESKGLGDDVRAGKIDVVMPVGTWQRDKIAAEEDLVDHPCWMQTSNGVDMKEFEAVAYERVPGRCIHTSTPERGLSLLLDVWPEIEEAEALAEKGIKPVLHLFSSFQGWGASEKDSDGMAGEQFAKVKQLQTDGYSIINHKHVPSTEMRQWQLSADLLLYPTNFDETYCISLTEAMAAGAIPVVSKRAALAERLQDGHNGFLVGELGHDATTEDAKDAFISKAITALWMDAPIKERIRKAAIETARRHDYPVLVADWTSQWQQRLEVPVP